MAESIFIFGLGYTGLRLASRLNREGWKVSGSVRSESTTIEGVHAYQLPCSTRSFLLEMLEGVTHVLFTAPVDKTTKKDPFFGDALLLSVLVELAEKGELQWAGYLSTTSVYGDADGSWVDENSPLEPGLQRGKLRVNAECDWLFKSGLPMQVFRLPGIYGPSRGTMAKVRNGTARCIVKENQVFSRIHVDDIVGAIMASMSKPNPGRVYNVVDDLPMNNKQVLHFACKLLDKTPPEDEAYDPLKLSPMARSFYSESKRVRNDRLKRELGYKLEYPTYVEGLKAQLAEELGQGWTIIDEDAQPLCPSTPRNKVKMPVEEKPLMQLFTPVIRVLYPLLQLFSSWHGRLSRFLLLLFAKKKQILLVDNGSLRAEPHLQLRKHAKMLESLLNIPTYACSVAHSGKIDPAFLDGKRAQLVEFIDLDLSKETIAVPYFLGPSRSIAAVKNRADKVADPLFSYVDGAIADILVKLIGQTASEKQLVPPFSVVLVDHGSPSRAMNKVRRGLAAQLRRRLGQTAVCVVDCSMERRPGPEYSFNDPLLEDVFGMVDEGDVVLAMGFLAPGRHAGPQGDVADIVSKAPENVRVHTTGVIGEEDEALVSILADRVRALID